MNNIQPLVSIIIPVYKVEKYLPSCIDSVLSQTYSNLEIILVDDGSPDRCGEICDAYAEKDHRIRVIHQENGGVAAARNTAISISQGEYLYFVDSDDLIAADTLEDLVTLAQTHNADMVCAATCSIDEQGAVMRDVKHESSSGTITLTQAEALRYYAATEWAPWNRLIKADIHREILFPHFKICEDEATKFKLIARCHTIVNTDLLKYFYRMRQGSATASDSKVDRMDMFYSRKQNLNYLKEHHPQIVSLFLPNFCDAALFNLDRLLLQDQNQQTQTKITQITASIKENVFAILKTPHYSLSAKLRCALIACSNWKKKSNLYIGFYSLLDRLRKR